MMRVAVDVYVLDVTVGGGKMFVQACRRLYPCGSQLLHKTDAFAVRFAKRVWLVFSVLRLNQISVKQHSI